MNGRYHDGTNAVGAQLEFRWALRLHRRIACRVVLSRSKRRVGLARTISNLSIARKARLLRERYPKVKRGTFHEPKFKGRVDQAQRIHHHTNKRRTMFATVDPLRLIHPTTLMRFVGSVGGADTGSSR
jgi:hypothetical protein